jgi:predicted Ser/Thr protein kinase
MATTTLKIVLYTSNTLRTGYHHIKHEKSHKRSLSVEVLHKIHALEITDKPVLHKYRQLFMLMFYLQGINFIDLASLKVSNI